MNEVEQLTNTLLDKEDLNPGQAAVAAACGG